VDEISGGETGDPTPQHVRARGNELDNGLCRVRLHPDGTFDVLDRRTDREYRGLNVLEDSGDVGDEYDYSPAPCSETVTSRGCDGTVECVREGGWSGILAARFEMELPRAAAPDRLSRTAERVSCPAEVRVELRAGSPVVRVETRFDNRVEDHRLRALFPTGIDTEHPWSDGHFLVQRRAVNDGGSGGFEDWVQPPPGTYPQQEYSLVQDGVGGLAVLNRGLPEMEARRAEGGGVELALTLLRSVGWLSRDDFASRRHSNAGPTLFTPEAQCPGERVFRYAVLPFGGDHMDAHVRRWSRTYRVDPVAVQGVSAGSVPGGRSLLRQESERAVITAIKKHVRRETLVVRLCNPSSAAVEEVLHTDAVIEGAWRTNLLEEREGELPFRPGHLDLRIEPYRVLTIELALRAP
jgi:alpha-mannosidase